MADALAGIIVLVFFSELFTKALFRAKSDSLLSFFASLAKFFYNILYPVVRIFVSLAAGILRFLFNVRLKEDSEPFVKTDVESYYQQSNEQNEEHPELNKELFENAFVVAYYKSSQMPCSANRN